ncbi:hypothetical protein Hanom_Chr09g00771911 [Helianthus anomalus]
MKYVEENEKPNHKKANLTRDWKFICHVFVVYLAPRKGGYDSLNLDWSAAMLNLCMHKPFNISRLIFTIIVSNAENKQSRWVMYPKVV